MEPEVPAGQPERQDHDDRHDDDGDAGDPGDRHVLAQQQRADRGRGQS
jgi:hypothetical protein